MLRILAVMVIPIALGACAQPRFVVRAGLDSINPMLAGATGPLPLIGQRDKDGGQKAASQQKNGGESRIASGDVRQREAAGLPRAPVNSDAHGKSGTDSIDGPVDRLPPGVIQAADSSFGTSQTVSMVPASGDQRSRLLRSAARLVGIVKSFDSRSFLGHLLAICDLLPHGRKSADWLSRDQMEQARAAGQFRDASGQAVPGEIVFFRCDAGCGADSADGVGVGIVVDSEGARTSFIAYRNGLVDRFDAAVDELIGYCAP